MKKYKIYSIVLIVFTIIMLFFAAFKLNAQDYKSVTIRDTIPAVLIICDTSFTKCYMKTECLYNEDSTIYERKESVVPLHIIYWINGYVVQTVIGFKNGNVWSGYAVYTGEPTITYVYLDENKKRLNKFVIVYKTK